MRRYIFPSIHPNIDASIHPPVPSFIRLSTRVLLCLILRPIICPILRQSVRPSNHLSILSPAISFVQLSVRSFISFFPPSSIHPSMLRGLLVGRSVLRSSSLAFGAVTKTQLTQSSIRAPRANLSRCVPLPLSHRPTSPLRPSAPDRVT